MCVLVAQSCPTLCDLLDCNLPGSSVHGILQGRILERVAMPSSRESFQPRDRAHVFCVSCIAGGFFTCWAIGEAPKAKANNRKKFNEDNCLKMYLDLFNKTRRHGNDCCEGGSFLFFIFEVPWRQETSHARPCEVTLGNTRVRKRQTGARGKRGQEPLLWFHWERQHKGSGELT